MFVSVWRTLDKNLERLALLIAYSMLVVTMTVEVMRRELLAYSSVWGEEVVRYAFIYLVWIGAAVAVRERAHIRIDVLFHACSNRTKLALYIFGDLIMLVVACFAFYWAWETVAVSVQFSSVSHGLRVPMVWFLSAVPVGFALIVFRVIQSIIRDIRDFLHDAPVFEGNKLFD